MRRLLGRTRTPLWLTGALWIAGACTGEVSTSGGQSDGSGPGDRIGTGDSGDHFGDLFSGDPGAGDVFPGDNLHGDVSFGDDHGDNGDNGDDAPGDPLGPITQLYVAPDGDDGNPGTLALPLETLQGARDVIRAIVAETGLPEGGITVFLRGGIYEQTTTFALRAPDSGTATSPITYRSYPGERARIMGGTQITRSTFTPVTSGSPVWSRLDASVQGNLTQVDLGNLGITDYGTLKRRGFAISGNLTSAMELFVDNVRLPLGRWPDEGQNLVVASHLADTVTITGHSIPNIGGTYTRSGTLDGVNAYARQGLVGGLQFNLYRHTWSWQGSDYTAWFITTATSGFPGASTDPRWHRYAAELGPFAAKPESGASGQPMVYESEALNSGFSHIVSGVSSTRFVYSRNRPPRWLTASDAWIHGYWHEDWADEHQPIAAIDGTAKTVTLTEPPSLSASRGNIRAGQTYYAYNLLEEITTPGEWYLDRSTGILYLWPTSNSPASEILVSILEVPVIDMVDVQWVRLQDLTVEVTRGTAISGSGLRDVRLEDCTVRHAGRSGITLSGMRVNVDRCQIYDVGEWGVSLTGGDRPTLTPANNQLTNSHIHHFGRICRTYRGAATVSGVGNRIANNHFHHGYHEAVTFGGNDHIVELNDIHDVCSFTGDAGAIYVGRQWGHRGNQVRHNFIHHIVSAADSSGVRAIYLDDCHSGTRVFGNILYDVPDRAILHGGGRDVVIENNVIARCGVGVHADSRGTSRITNIPGDSWNLLEKLNQGGIDWQGEPWASAYPALAALPNNWATLSAPTATWLYPEDSVMRRNVTYLCGIDAYEANPGTFGAFGQIGNNLTDTDPLFVDEAGGDFSLAPSSPAFTIPGFQDIPFDQIGVQP